MGFLSVQPREVEVEEEDQSVLMVASQHARMVTGQHVLMEPPLLNRDEDHQNVEMVTSQLVLMVTDLEHVLMAPPPLDEVPAQMGRNHPVVVLSQSAQMGPLSTRRPGHPVLGRPVCSDGSSPLCGDGSRPGRGGRD